MRLIDRANERVKTHVAARYSKITVYPGKCRYNFHCHSNAVHDAVKKKENRIALVIYFDGNSPVVHFINAKSDGTFKDNTLGYWSKLVDYYFIRWIPESEFNDVYKIHESLKSEINKLVPWIIRYLSKFSV